MAVPKSIANDTKSVFIEEKPRSQPALNEDRLEQGIVIVHSGMWACGQGKFNLFRYQESFQLNYMRL